MNLPKTNFNLGLGQINSRRFDENFSISQDIPNPNLIKAKRELALQNVGVSQQKLAINKQELVFNIKQSWYQITYLQALNQVLTKEDSLLQQFVKAANLKFKTGESSILERTIAENKQLELKQNTLQINHLIAVEKLKLNQLMNNNMDFSINENVFKSLDFSEITDTSLIKNNPLLLFAKQQMAVIEAEKNVVKADALPDFKIGYFIQSIAGLQDVNGQVRDYNSIPRFQGIQLGVNVPIFGKSAYKAKNEAINTQFLAQQKQTDYLQTQLQNQLKQYVEAYNFDKNNVAYYEKTALPNAQLIIEKATKAYRSGDIGYVEYAQALQTNLAIQKAYTEAINKLNKTIISIQFIVNN